MFEPGGVMGNVDAASFSRIRGWAFDPRMPDRRVGIVISLGRQRLVTALADQPRTDLLELGFGDGCHGFEVDIPQDVFTSPMLSVQVRVADTGAELAGSPVDVRAISMPLDAAGLATFARSIAAACASAEAAPSLDELRAWLSHHQDMVYKRQTVLIRAAVHRDIWFTELLAEKATLANILRETARMTVAQYDPLRLDPVEDPQVSVIIPAYNHFAHTYRCLQAILAHLPTARFEVVVVDDGSTDETMHGALVLLGGIRFVRSPRNAGFLVAVTLGANNARGQYLMLLNNDTQVQDGWLDHLHATFLRDPAIGVAGSKLIASDGSLQEAGAIVWRQGTALNWGRGQDPDDPRFCFMRDADYVSGAALMIERALFDAVGGLSVEFAPAYYEDTDLCFKVRAAGRRVVVQPQSRIVHHEGVTGGTDEAGSQAKRHQRLNHHTFLLKWFETLQGHGLSNGDPQAELDRAVTKRALFIDGTTPTPDQDAGSNAAIQFMLSLQRLGYTVAFVGADNLAQLSPYTESLEGLGIQCFYRPTTPSLEACIGGAPYDVVFVHRPAYMAQAAPIIRRLLPKAAVIYCVADLHHLRLEREADVRLDEGFRQAAQPVRISELAMAAEADAVIVHSSFEAAYLQREAPAANVHVVPWTCTPVRPVEAFAERKGIAFIGGFNHTPNVDAATWLIKEIMPLVWQEDPTVECLLIGSQMPAAIHALRRERVHIVGHVPDLRPTFNRLRLTVAPLRYGAGLKGKVLTSLAAGLPCVATPCAVEGMDLPKMFDVCCGVTPRELAAKILLVHGDERLNDELGQAGLDFIARTCSPARVDSLLAQALAPRPKRPPVEPRRAIAAPPKAKSARKPRAARTESDAPTPGQ